MEEAEGGREGSREVENGCYVDTRGATRSSEPHFTVERYADANARGVKRSKEFPASGARPIAELCGDATRAGKEDRGARHAAPINPMKKGFPENRAS